MRIVAWVGVVMLVCGCVQTPPQPTPAVTPRTAQTISPATTAPTTAATVAPTRAPTSRPTASLPAGGSIRGTITAFTSRGYVPSTNTGVELRPEIPTDPSDPPRATARTNTDGQYMLERVENGRYLLTAGGGGIGSPRANVTIAGADLILDLQLDPIAAALVHKLLTGRVVDSGNRPVSGASVFLTDGTCHATTGSDGTYSMAVIHNTNGQRVLNATTSAQSGFVIVSDSETQPQIQLTRPAVSGVPSDVCPTRVGLAIATPTPAPGRGVTVLRTVVLPRITASLVPKP
jgi:hypothetical protein